MLPMRARYAWRSVALLLAASLASACDARPYRSAVVETRARDPRPAASAAQPAARVLRFSVASIESPRDTYSAYTRLFDRVGRVLGTPIQFEQRRTYREVNDLLIAGRLDAALLCTGGYLDLERRAPGAVEIVAVPVVHGRESYQSLVIVPAAGGETDVSDLRGKRFAYTDELSFSGRAYAEKVLRDRGFDPARFFGSVLYTGSHDRSIQAVASGLVDGAAVHGGILAQMEERDPSLERRIRIIHRSPPLGGMPIVASARLSPALRARLRDALLGLERDEEGAASLRLLRFDRFAEPSPDLYAAASRIFGGR
jgi:phosphate/phosphite/phosphonate ABC transporter binding protein